MKIKTLFKFILVCQVGFILVVVFQGIQYFNSIHDARFNALNSWVNGDTSKAKQMAAYLKICDGSTVVDTRTKKPLETPYSIYECASKFGSDELSNIIVTADNSVFLPAPLKWL